MPAAYSKDLRVRVIRAIEGGRSRHEAARLLEVSPSSAIKWYDRWRRSGSAEAKSAKGCSRSPLNKHADFLLDLIVKEPDLTLEEIKGRLRAIGVEIEISSIWRFYDRNGISFKKNRVRERARQARHRRSARALERNTSLSRSRKTGLRR